MSSFIDISASRRDGYNKVVSHPLQSYEWGEFRKHTGVKVIRRGLIKKNELVDGFTLTFHKVPFTNRVVGYLPKGDLPSKETLQELYLIGKQKRGAFIQLEPSLTVDDGKLKIEKLIKNCKLKIVNSFHPLFTKYTFMLDLTKSEDELLGTMHPKTRYNIKIAQRHGVWVEEDNSEEGFQTYLSLLAETTKRQGFYAHSPSYHRLQWEMFPKSYNPLEFSYHLLHARLKDSSGDVHALSSWVLFIFKDVLYYPYGASNSIHRNVMASNLLMWEAIRFGKRLGLKKFDLWGALGPNPDISDPWYGFHRFKEGYGGTLVEFVGSYDLIINQSVYEFLKLADKARWFFLKLQKR